MQTDLRDKVALVTGSTYGIGKAVALKLASNGADTVINLYSTHIAEAVLFFASDDSSAITGQILSVNGGLCFPG